MTKLEQIFLGKEELLKDPAVQELIKIVTESHELSWKTINHWRNFHDNVLELFVYSRHILKSGMSDTEFTERVGKLLEEF
jgi:hypothetical protein